MKFFIDRLIPSEHLPSHLTLIMTRAVSRDEAVRWAPGAQRSFTDVAVAARVEADLGLNLKYGKAGIQSNAWEAILVEVTDKAVTYWLLQIR